MNRLESTLIDIVARLQEESLGFALVGGLAVSARSEPRFTRDVDLAVAVRDDKTAEDLVKRLLSEGFGVLAAVEQEVTDRLATIRLLPPGQTEEGVVIDLLFASSGIETEIVASADRIEVFPGVYVPVATVAHLIALKVLSRDQGRPQDDTDLRYLLREGTEGDVNAARHALTLVADRGYERGRDLQASLDEVLARWRE